MEHDKYDYHSFIFYKGASLVAQIVKHLPNSAGDLGSIPGSGRSPGEGHGNRLQFLPGKFHGQRSLVVYSPWGLKESDTTEQLHMLYKE